MHIPLAVAGGIDAAGAGEAVRRGADIVIVGGWIIRSADVTGSTKRIRSEMDNPSIKPVEKKSPDEEIRAILPPGFSTECLGCHAPERGNVRDCFDLR